MKNVIKQINDFLGMTTGLLMNLIVAGTIIGILYDDVFGVIAGIGNAEAIGDGGVVGLVAVMIVAMWMKK